MKKIKTVKSVTLAKKIKTIKPVTPTKNIVSSPIESISASISIPVKSICDSFLVEFDLVKSIEYVKNSFPYNMIFDSAYLLALIVFTLNNKELKKRIPRTQKEENQTH